MEKFKVNVKGKNLREKYFGKVVFGVGVNNAHKFFRAFTRIVCKIYCYLDSKPTEPHFTFEKGGLYDSLRESVAKKIGKNHGPTPYMKQLTVFFTAIWFISFLITCSTKSVFFAVISGILLNPIWGIGHNFFHQKDTFLRFLFNLNITTSYEWRVSHALSHHT